ncbi:MAG: TolB family protein [Vicinamibacterales bacterium]
MWQRAAIAAVAVAAAVALSIPAIRYFSKEPPPLRPAVRLSLAPPDGTELGGGDDVLDAAISPDQQELVFVARWVRRNAAGDPPGSTQLWRRRFDAQIAEPLAGTEGASLPAWKHTGNVVSFFAGTRLKLLNLKTGAVSDAAEAPSPAGAIWLRDGSLLFVPGTGPIRRLLDGRVTDATRLRSGDVAHAFPAAPVNGQEFTYVAVRGDGRRVVRLRASETETDLGTTSTHAELLDRWLLFVRDATLLVDYRGDDGRMGGHDFPLALDVGATERARGMFAASADMLLHAPAGEHRRQIGWLDLLTARSGTVGDVGDFWQIRVSPDDRSVAVTARDPLLGSLDVLNVPVDDQAATLRLTTSIAADSDPVWSPDGRRIAVRSMQRGRPEVLVMPAALQAAADRPDSAPATGTTGDLPTDWRAGEMLVQRRAAAGWDLVRVQATGTSRVVADSPFNETDGRWSPDGRWTAYVSDEPGRPEIYVHNEHGDRQRISQGGGTHPRWARDSRALLFLRESTLMRAELGPGGSRFGTPRRLVNVGGIRDFDLAHTRTDRIFTLMPVQPGRREAVSVILNWRSLAESQRRRLESKTPPKF